MLMYPYLIAVAIYLNVKKKIFILTVLKLSHYIANMSPEPIVTIKQGVLKGQTEKTKSGVEFNSFLGIPYAQPPIGELRFKVSIWKLKFKLL